MYVPHFFTDLKINFDDNYELINLLIHVRIQLFDAFKWCAQQIEDGSKESILLSKEWFKIKNTSTDTREQEIAVINGEMSKLEEEAYNTLKFYLLGIVITNIFKRYIQRL